MQFSARSQGERRFSMSPIETRSWSSDIERGRKETNEEHDTEGRNIKIMDTLRW